MCENAVLADDCSWGDGLTQGFSIIVYKLSKTSEDSV